MAFRKKRVVGFFSACGPDSSTMSLKRKYATTAMSLPFDWLVKKSVTSADLQRQTPRVESSGGGKRDTHTSRPQTQRIGDGGGRGAASAQSKHSHTEPPQSRLLPTAGTFRSALCVHFSRGRCGFVTCRRNNPTQRNHKLAIERTIFMVTRSTNSTLLTIYDMCNLTQC